MATDPSEAAKRKACELANAAGGYALWEPKDCDGLSCPPMHALARYIQAVSDAVKEVALDVGHEASEPLAPFILPDPVDPLLIEARELAARDAIDADHCSLRSDDGHLFYGKEAARVIRAGNADKNIAVRGRIAALRRGMELAKEPSHG